MNIGDHTYYSINGRFYSKFYGKTFLLLYHFNYKNEDLFEDDAEALKSYKADKYSIIGELSDYFRISEKFEFVLWYPSFINHWKQSKNPVFEHETNSDHDKNATGYEPLHIGSYSHCWGGLVYSSQNHKKGSHGSLLDGSTYHSAWYYSIAPFYSLVEKTFPVSSISESEAALWVRMPIYLTCKCNKNDGSKFKILILVIIISS